MAIASLTMRNTLVSAYVAAATYTGLLSALTLQASTLAGATTFSTDLSVGVGDTVTFDVGTGTQESRVVTAVSGTGPYTVTVAALTYAHTVNAMISHQPIVLANAHELTGGSPAYARVASNWGAVSNSAATATPAAINVPAGSKVGSVMQASASSSGTLLDVEPVVGQLFSTAGTYPPVVTYTQS